MVAGKLLPRPHEWISKEQRDRALFLSNQLVESERTHAGNIQTRSESTKSRTSRTMLSWCLLKLV